MAEFEFLCLANSRRLGGRCVAGLVPERGWVRPVPDRKGGSIPKAKDWHFCALDVVRVDLGKPAPIIGQPENVLLRRPAWFLRKLETLINTLLRRPAWFSRDLERFPSHLRDELETLIEERPEMLTRGLPDRIAHRDLERHPISASLVLVEPESVKWYIHPPTSYRGWQVRCEFDMGWNRDLFDLAVTDIDIEGAILGLAHSPYERIVPDIPDGQRLLLTLSLGEELNGYHYKLVAAAIELPA